MLALNPGFAQHYSGDEVLHSSGIESLSSNPNYALAYDLWSHCIISRSLHSSSVMGLTCRDMRSAQDKVHEMLSILFNIQCPASQPATHLSSQPASYASIHPSIHPSGMCSSNQAMFEKNAGILESKQIKTGSFQKMTSAKIKHK